MDLRTLKELEDLKAMRESSRLNIYLQENGDHVLLRQGRHTLARLPSGAQIFGVMREIESGKYRS